MKKLAAMLALILALLSLPPGIAEDAFQPVDFAEVAGYYTVGEDNYLFLADGSAYVFSAEEIEAGELWGPRKFAAYSDGTRLLIDDLKGVMACLVPQPEKGVTESGGIYYAFYADYEGLLGDDFDEGSEVAFGNHVFDNDYVVCLRQPLSAFFGVDAAANGYGKIEGPGYATPEEAVTAYIRAFQKSDLDGMLSTFAVETFAERYDLAKMVERLRAYPISLVYVPNISDYSHALNVESRRSEIVDSIRYQYLTLTGATCTDGKTVTNAEKLPGEEFLAEIFATDDSPWLAEIDFQGEFLEPQALTELYYNETNQNIIARLIDCYGGDESRSMAARLEIAGEPYIQFMDVIRYGDRWYNLTPMGNLALLLGLNSFSGGLSPYPIPED